MNILCFCISCTPAATMPISNFALELLPELLLMSTTASSSPGFLTCSGEAAFLVPCPVVRVFSVL